MALRQSIVNHTHIDVVPVLHGAVRPARIVHHVPGRLRIKVLDARGEADFFAAVQRVIGGLSGVASVRVNPSSSSIVVDYKPSDSVFHFRLQDDSALRSWLSLDKETDIPEGLGAAVVRSTRYLERHSRLAESIVSTAEHLDAGLREVSAGYLDLKVLLPLSVAVATSMHKGRNKGTPMWLTLSTFAFNAFLSLHRHRIGVPIVRVIARTVRSG
jgi:hypothetical protein